MVRKRTRPVKIRPVRKPVDFELKEKAVVNKKLIIVALVGIIFLTLFLNSYFNYTSGVAINEDGETLGEKYYLSGPDPYYHARITEFIYYNGYVPFWEEGDRDPLLEYPMEHPNPRPPLFDLTMAVGAHLLSPFMSDIDALGHSIQFAPAIYGALLVIPVYCIGAALFNRKAGLVGALFIPLIPIHLGSGHGSAYTLADHDSFILLLSTIGLFFFIRTLQTLNDKYSNIKELFTINKKAICFAILTGFSYALVALSWEGFKMVVVLLALYCILQLFINCWFKKDFLSITLVGTISLLTTSLIISPYYWGRGTFNDVEIILSLVGIILLVGLILHFLKERLPAIVTLPTLFVGGSVALYIINMFQIKPMYYFVVMFFKGSVYTGKISRTIAEAGASDISRSVMAFGPVLYWVAWAGAIIFMARTMLHRKKEMIFMSMWFLLTLYFTMTAGRFLNDFIPFIAVFAGWTVCFVIEKIDYRKMIRNIKSIGGFKGVRKGIKLLHIGGILFVVLGVLLPNVILAYDASIPWEKKEGSGAFGISLGKEKYWTDAFDWLNEQDIEIEDPGERPAFISWWDYGFYEIMIGQHPTVADNFQDGVEVAANFKTARSEKEAITVLIGRLIYGDFYRINKRQGLSDDVTDVLRKHVGTNETNDITNWLLDLTSTPEYNKPICEEYDEHLSREFRKNELNGFYHSFVNITSKLTDEEVTEFYMDIQDATGWNIRYYGTEQYDTAIFTVFIFLADKSLIPVGGTEDDFLMGYFVATDEDTGETSTLNSEEYTNLTTAERYGYVFSGPFFDRRPAYYETMFYRTYYGILMPDGSLPAENRMPTYSLKHFSPGYISPYVVIAKYYEGYKVNGIITCQNISIPGVTIVVFDEFGIPHDTFLFFEGQYNVITPAGNIRLGVYLKNTLLKTVDLNVTELEATRRTENYNKTINIEINPVSINGTIYKNETTLPNTDITLFGELTGLFTRIKTDENGYYEFKNIPPNVYTLQTLDYNETIIVAENMNFDMEVGDE